MKILFVRHGDPDYELDSLTQKGDVSHLYVADEPPAFAARFCECYTNEDERH